MPWFKVDDRLPTSRKMLRIPRPRRTASIGLWTIAGAWSAHDLTDGFVPDYMVEEWGGTLDDAGHLVDAGLWEHGERDGDTGFQFVNWDEYQPMKAQVEAKREYERERKRQQRRDGGGKFAGQSTVPDLSHRDNPGTTGGSPTVSDRDSTVPVPSRPVPSPSSASRATEKGTRVPDDFTITEDMKAWAAANVPGVNLEWQTQKFIDYFASLSGQRAIKKDWRRAWQNWMRTEYERTAPQLQGKVFDPRNGW